MTPSLLDRPSSTTEPMLEAPESEALESLRHIVEHAAHLLPAQGPITVFIHHNTLHAFEDLAFDQAVKNGWKVFGCQPYLTEKEFRDAVTRGRIRFADLRDVVKEELTETNKDHPLPLSIRIDLRLAMLHIPLRGGTENELEWFVEETDALRKFGPGVSTVARSRWIAETRRWVMREFRSQRSGRNENGHGPNVKRRQSLPAWMERVFNVLPQANMETWEDDSWEAFTLQCLWEISKEVVRLSPGKPAETAAVRLRDALVEAGADDPDVMVHDLLIRFCGAFLDQGVSHSPLPERERGFFHAFANLYRQKAGPPEAWLRTLPAELDRLLENKTAPLACMAESLRRLGVPEHERGDFISATLLALRGWGGMVWQVESRSDRVAFPIPEGALIEFLAIRLLLDVLASEHVAKTCLSTAVPLDRLHASLKHPPRPGHTVGEAESLAFAVFQITQVMGGSLEELNRYTPNDWADRLGEIESFSAVERRRIFQAAYERRLRTQTLDALLLRTGAMALKGKPRFQVMTCLDEREESFRRHLEEVAPDVETFGAAGFYSMPMYYRGKDDAYFVPLCPVIVRPRHWITEEVDDAHEASHRQNYRTLQVIGNASHRINVGSRSFAWGALLTACFGVLASIPLVARIWFPRVTGIIVKGFAGFFQKPVKTRLNLEQPETPIQAEQRAFSLDELATNGERLLRDLGMVSSFSRLVFILGHGSNSMNNPHKSAYDCGACGGNSGGPNARALAQTLNDPRVRERLTKRGIFLPSETFFVGAVHNTCDDSVTLFDQDRIPDSHRAEFERAWRDLQEACDRNAHERCRRFVSAPLTMTFAEARRHVEGRSEDLAQTRPELGHATNAICVVGRRSRTRGLFLDRRAFLTSYDPTQDDAESSILTRILQAVFPVCSGINLEYYFSRVDSPGWGCGSKLPHNVTALLGVMDGAASDLRTGLPWQMVEIHEPVRLLIIVECTVDAMLGILRKQELIGNLARNEWVQLALLDPDSASIQTFQNGRFEPYKPEAANIPTVEESADWYRGCREHLEFAEVVPAASGHS